MSRTLKVHVRIDPPNPHPTKEELSAFFDGELEELEKHLKLKHPESFGDGLTRIERVAVRAYMIFLCERQET
jgi:hypothetical protein